MAIADKQYECRSTECRSTTTTDSREGITYTYHRGTDTFTENVKKDPTIKENIQTLFSIISLQRDMIASIAKQIGVPIKPMDAENMPAENLSAAIRSLVVMTQVNNEYLTRINETLE